MKRKIRIELHFAYWWVRLLRNDIIAWAYGVDEWEALRADTNKKFKQAKSEVQ